MSFVVVAYSTSRTYSNRCDWLPHKNQELQGLTGCLLDVMSRANGPPTPGLRSSLAVDATTDVAFRYAQALGRIQQIQNFGATSIQCCGSPHSQFILTSFLCTLQRSTSERSRQGASFIRTLQHSIRGAGLTLTSAGVTPARQSDLASPHVQPFVRHCESHRWRSRETPVTFATHCWVALVARNKCAEHKRLVAAGLLDSTTD